MFKNLCEVNDSGQTLVNISENVRRGGAGRKTDLGLCLTCEKLALQYGTGSTSVYVLSFL